MHKELNSVKGSNMAMMAWWRKNSISAPTLLANKDNDAMLKLAEIVNGLDAIVKCALEASSFGGVKAASLAGVIFNHKNDKKGQLLGHASFFLLGYQRHITLMPRHKQYMLPFPLLHCHGAY